MALLQRIWIILSTRNIKGAGTDSAMQLDITSRGMVAQLPLGDQPGDQFAPPPNKPDLYTFDVSHHNFDDAAIAPRDFRLTLTQDPSDGWLPQSIFIIGRNVNGEYKVLLATPDWPSDKWFDRDASGGGRHSVTWLLDDSE